MSIFGTTEASNSSGTADSTWTCLVDDKEIPIEDPIPFSANNWRLCKAESLNPGTHVISMTAKTSGRPFWFDYIQYAPSPSLEANDVDLVLSHRDTSITYGDGWKPLGEYANMTQATGATVNITFFGLPSFFLFGVHSDFLG